MNGLPQEWVWRFGLNRLIVQFLVAVRPTDAVTYASVAAGLVGVWLLACYVPARRAAKVDPMMLCATSRRN